MQLAIKGLSLETLPTPCESDFLLLAHMTTLCTCLIFPLTVSQCNAVRTHTG